MREIDYRELDKNPRTSNGEPEAMPRLTRYGSPEAAEFGLVPISDFPDLIIPKSDWGDVIKECHEKKIFPLYHQEAAGWAKDGWNQDGLGYCWAFALAACVMDTRQSQGQQPVLLAPTSLGWLVGWRNRGFFLDAAIAGARQNGIAPATHIPELSINPRTFKDGWDEEALKYRPMEWWDTNRRSNDDAYIGQCLAILRTGRPLYVAYNWWGHAVECIGVDMDSKGSIKWIIRNSHGEKEPIVLIGERGIPDEAYGIREITFAE